jgi:predicted acetyltransferase
MPTFSFARMTPDDLPAVARIVSLSFTGTREQAVEWLNSCGHEHLRIIREAGARSAEQSIAANLLRIPMGQFFGGRSVPLIGIAAVGVTPEARGRGIAGGMMAAALREMHDEGVPLSGLYAATQPLYRRVGYEQAGHRFEIRLPLTTAAAAGTGEASRRDQSLVIRELTDADDEAVRACYTAFARQFDGPLDRGPYIWRRIRELRELKYERFAVTADSGEIEGYIYLITRRTPERNRQEVIISDLAFTTPRAGRRLLALLGDFGSMADEALLFGGPMHPALVLLSEQRFRISLRDHWMLRIVDVPGVLQARGYREHIRAGITFDVRDDIIPQNAGRWRVEVQSGRAQAERAASGSSSAISLDIGALAPLFSGYLSATQLRLLGQLEGDQQAIAACDSIFAGTTPWMSDMY